MDEGAWSFNEAKALNYFYMVGYNAFIWWSDTAISLQALYKGYGSWPFPAIWSGDCRHLECPDRPISGKLLWWCLAWPLLRFTLFLIQSINSSRKTPWRANMKADFRGFSATSR